MASIIIEDKTKQLPKGKHKCFEKDSFLKGLYSLSNYCPQCGEYLLEEKPVKILRCSECGEIVLFNARFCSGCGAKFENPPKSEIDFKKAADKPIEYLTQAVLKDPGTAVSAVQILRKGLKTLGFRF